ncbi:MAG: Protein-tyrosine phosphatase, low molecular weight, partial [Dehalococcoidia bacterium]|nr:Protein-tyrosine phosphatase, low molecular weight [Dehalococcoidia bacterium]
FAGGLLGAAAHELLLKPRSQNTAAAQLEAAGFILFVCVHNSGRSQMAKAFFNAAAAARRLPFRAESAGTVPGERINSLVAEAMREIGFDLSAERPKAMTDAMVVDATRVITMGCAVDAAACPAILLKGVVDWGLPDPAGMPLEEVRQVREMVRDKVDALIKELRP